MGHGPDSDGSRRLDLIAEMKVVIKHLLEKRLAVE